MSAQRSVRVGWLDAAVLRDEREDLLDQGRLKLAGPLPAIDAEDPGEAGFTGSVIVAEFDSIDDAKLWAADDPYVHAGVYDTILVKPYRHVLP